MGELSVVGFLSLVNAQGQLHIPILITVLFEKTMPHLVAPNIFLYLNRSKVAI